MLQMFNIIIDTSFEKPVEWVPNGRCVNAKNIKWRDKNYFKKVVI